MKDAFKFSATVRVGARGEATADGGFASNEVHWPKRELMDKIQREWDALMRHEAEQLAKPMWGATT